MIWVLGLVQWHVGFHSDDIANGDVLAEVVLVRRVFGGVRGKKPTSSTSLSVVVVV